MNKTLLKQSNPTVLSYKENYWATENVAHSLEFVVLSS